MTVITTVCEFSLMSIGKTFFYKFAAGARQAIVVFPRHAYLSFDRLTSFCGHVASCQTPVSFWLDFHAVTYMPPFKFDVQSRPR